jgi:hypothetical protein
VVTAVAGVFERPLLQQQQKAEGKQAAGSHCLWMAVVAAVAADGQKGEGCSSAVAVAVDTQQPPLKQRQKQEPRLCINTKVLHCCAALHWALFRWLGFSCACAAALLFVAAPALLAGCLKMIENVVAAVKHLRSLGCGVVQR